jgi:hypothetical protein
MAQNIVTTEEEDLGGAVPCVQLTVNGELWGSFHDGTYDARVAELAATATNLKEFQDAVYRYHWELRQAAR